MSEIDDTPGSRIDDPHGPLGLGDDPRPDVLSVPADWLDQSPVGRGYARRQQRLHMAYRLFCSLVGGCWSKAIGPGNSTDKLRRWCWEQADAFLADGNKPAAGAAVTHAGFAGRRPVDPIKLADQDDAA